MNSTRRFHVEQRPRPEEVFFADPKEGKGGVFHFSQRMGRLLWLSINVPECKSSSSHHNPGQAAAALSAAVLLRERHPEATVAILTFYRGQMDHLCKETPAALGVDVLTVDACQGCEHDYVVWAKRVCKPLSGSREVPLEVVTKCDKKRFQIAERSSADFTRAMLKILNFAKGTNHRFFGDSSDEGFDF